MLDWFSSKLAVSLAAMLLLSSTAAYFSTDDDRVRDRELATIARGISEFVGEVLKFRGETDLRISCDSESDLTLPKDVRGSPYRVQLRPDSAVASQDDRLRIAHWTGDLHLWWHDSSPIRRETIERLDEEHQSIESDPQRGFSVSIREVDIGGSSMLLFFAYPTS